MSIAAPRHKIVLTTQQSAKVLREITRSAIRVSATRKLCIVVCFLHDDGTLVDFGDIGDAERLYQVTNTSSDKGDLIPLQNQNKMTSLDEFGLGSLSFAQLSRHIAEGMTHPITPEHLRDPGKMMQEMGIFLKQCHEKDPYDHLPTVETRVQHNYQSMYPWFPEAYLNLFKRYKGSRVYLVDQKLPVHRLYIPLEDCAYAFAKATEEEVSPSVVMKACGKEPEIHLTHPDGKTAKFSNWGAPGNSDFHVCLGCNDFSGSLSSVRWANGGIPTAQVRAHCVTAAPIEGSPEPDRKKLRRG